MKTAQEIFREERRKKGISLKFVSEKTKIPLKYLEGIEKGNHQVFPNLHYAQLYVRDYAKFLGLSPQGMASLFRRDWSGEWKGTNVLHRREVKIKSWGKGAIVAGIIGTLAGAYLLYQYILFNSPPPLRVKLRCEEKKLIIEGRTKADAGVKINEEITRVSPQGEFKKEFKAPLPEKVVIEVKSPIGKIRRREFLSPCR